MIKKTARLGCHHFYCCLEPSFAVILVPPRPSLLWFCDWNRHHEERQVEDAVLCVLLIVAVGNRSLIGCFLAQSPLCCACDTTRVTNVFFLRLLPHLRIFTAQNFWTYLWRSLLSTRQGRPEVLGLCSQLSKEDKHERRGKKKPQNRPSIKEESLLMTSLLRLRFKSIK